MSVSENVEITGHLMDSGILSRVLDDIREYGGDFVIEEFDVGHEAHDPSSARIIVEAEKFRPPPAPPFPAPRTWQRGLAWTGIFVAPLIALVLGLLSVYVNPLIGWVLVGWFVGGFAYLVLEMPKSPRDPWDDGSRI